MKPDQDDRLGVGGDLSEPTQRSVERLRTPEIVGEVANPVLETVRRLWWRALDCVCTYCVFIRLSISDRIFGPEPPTPADLKREDDHELLISPLRTDSLPLVIKIYWPQNADDAIMHAP
jgi:hypothetical protein